MRQNVFNNEKSLTNRKVEQPDLERVLLDAAELLTKPKLVSLLKEQGFPTSGTKSELLLLLNHAAISNSFAFDFLKETILSSEAWSHRHTYNFQTNFKDVDPTKPEAFIESGFLSAINRPRKFLVPLKRQIDSIQLRDGALKIYLCAPAYYERDEPHENFDRAEENLKFYATRKIYVRKVYYFELNLMTGMGFLSIPAMQAHGKYSKELELVEDLLKEVLPAIELKKLNIQSAIPKLRQFEDVLNKGLNLLYPDFKATLRTTSKKPLVNEKSPNELKKLVEKSFQEEGVFEAYEKQDSICNFRIYKDQRLGTFKDLNEEEYRRVLGLVLDNAK